MVVDEVDIIGQGREGSPEEEAVDEPSPRVSVLL